MTENTGRLPEGTATAILESIADGLYALDRDWRFTLFNDQCERYFGKRRSEALGRTYLDVFPAARGSYVHEALERAFATGEPQRVEGRSPVTDVPILLRAFPSEEGLAVVFTDVSERYEAAESQRASEERLRRAVSIETVGVLFFRLDGEILDANPAFQRTSGWSVEALRSLEHWEDLTPPEFIEATLDTARSLAATGWARPYEKQLVRPDGSRWWGLFAPTRLAGEGELSECVEFIVDITDRKRTEESLKASEELFRTAFEQAPDDAIIVMELNRTLTAWNPAAERIMGWTAEEAVGQPADIIFTPEDRAQGAPQEETGTAARHGKAANERWHIRKDRSRFWGSGTMNALHDADGSVRGFLKVFRDATTRHLQAQSAELLNEELEARVEERTRDLERAVREAEGFNYAISHDLRTPLRAIATTSSILMEEAGPELSFGHRELLRRQGRAASRLAQLIDGLLDLSRLSRVNLQRTRIDMTREARECTRDSGCPVEVQEGMEAVGDPGLVRSVWQNLIGNACKFSPQGGAVSVGEENGEFFVRDQGVGFDMRYAPKIFLPFERLVADDEFSGTGIGLANVKRIVERHGGQVWAESEPGKGSTFRFTLGPSEGR